MLGCGCLAADFAVVEVGLGGWEAAGASYFEAAVARAADQNSCTFPCCGGFGGPPVSEAKRIFNFSDIWQRAKIN